MLITTGVYWILPFEIINDYLANKYKEKKSGKKFSDLKNEFLTVN